MKRIKKLLCVMVALVLSLCIFAFAACDDGSEGTTSGSDSVTENTSDGTEAGASASSESTTESSSSEESDSEDEDNDNESSSVLAMALLATLNEIYTSTTGYEFTIGLDYTMTNGSLVSGYGVGATILTQNDGENFNLDGEAYLSATASEDVDGEVNTYTEYTYLSALLRGADLYAVKAETNEEGMTSEELQDLVYEYTDFDGLLGLLTENETISSYLTLLDGTDYDGIISAISGAAAGLIADMQGTISTTMIPSGTSGSYYLGISLTYDFDEILTEYVTTAYNMLTLIFVASELYGDYTLNDLMGISSVQEELAQYLDGYTGEDVYSILSFVSTIIEAVNTDSSMVIILPEATADQSAYDYITVLTSSEYYGSFVLNNEQIMSYITKATELTASLKTALSAATIECKIILNSATYALYSVTFDIHNLTISGYDIELDFDMNMQSKEVTLTDISGINISQAAAYVEDGAV